MVRRSGWVGDYGAHRAEIERLLAPARAGVADGFDRSVDPKRQDLIARLEAAGLPSDLAAEHGRALTPASKSAAAIHGFVEGLGWKGRTFDRLVSQFYKTLKASLAQTPEAERGAAAKQSVEALRRAMIRIGDSDRLIPAIGAVVSLFDFETRQIARGDVRQPDPSHAVASAIETVESLCTALGDRSGSGRALTLFPALVEQLERTYGPLTTAKRRALRDRTVKFLVETGPLSGFAPQTGGQLSMAVTRAIPGSKSPEGALAAAATAYRRGFVERHREVVKTISTKQEGIEGEAAEACDALTASLLKVLKAHPTAPESFNLQVINLNQTLTQQLRYNYGNSPQTYRPLAELIDRFAATPSIGPLLAWIGKIYYSLSYQEKSAAALARAIAEPSVPKAARHLAEVSLGAAEPIRELAALEKLPPSLALATALALHSTLSGGSPHSAGVVRAVIDEAKSAQREDPFVHLEKFAERIGPLLTALGEQGVERDRAALAAELARASASAQHVGYYAGIAARMLRAIEQKLPAARPLELAADAWALADPNARWRVQPEALFNQILEQIPKSQETDAARFALQLARAVANLDGDHEIPFAQILADVGLAFRRPSKLTFANPADPANLANGGGTVIQLRAQGQQGPLAFLRDHPELPVELAFTASLHLNKGQLAWVCERCRTVRGRDTLRALRDFTFGCIAAKQKKFFDAIRTSQAPAKGVSRAIHFVARAYREGKLDGLPWAEIEAGLIAGTDPIARLEEERTRSALEALNLKEILAGEIDPAGLDELSRCGDAIRNIMEHLQPAHTEDGIDLHERLYGVFVDVLKAVAEGRWPSHKYDTEIGRKNLACLKREQEALWRAESVTGMQSGAPRMSEIADAVFMLYGLDRALREHGDIIKTAGLGRLGFTANSLARLEKAHGEVLDQLRATRRGTAEHRALGIRAKELAVPLALVRFSFAVKAAKGDAQSILQELRPVLPELAGALSERRVPNLAKIIARIDYVARTISTSPKEGTYAADEDGLYPLLTATHTGGCVGYDGFRRYSNVAFAANAGDKMICAYQGEKFVGRALFKLFEGEVEGWDGPVLWLNNVALTNGGTEEHKKLIVRHAVLKAQAMGLPLLGSEIDFGPVAAELGLPSRNSEVKGKVPDNATGTSFTNYQIVPSDSHDIRKLMDGKPYFEHSKTCSVVMPAGWVMKEVMKEAPQP